MPFGVELPDNLGEEKTSAPEGGRAPEGAAPEGSQDLSTKAAHPEAVKDILDLDKVERFRFNGRELTPKELKDATLRWDDYSKKTAEVAEARKYADNFASDLRTLASDPQKYLGQFRQIYPKSYVDAAMKILSSNASKDPNADTSKRIDPNEERLARLEGTMTEWEKRQFDAEVQSIQSWLTNQYESLGKKYPYANQEVVSARAEVFSRQGNQVTDKVLDKLFKQSNDELKSYYDKMYKSTVAKQISTGSKGKDVGPGGGIPSTAPAKGAKTLREARDKWLADLES